MTLPHCTDEALRPALQVGAAYEGRAEVGAEVGPQGALMRSGSKPRQRYMATRSLEMAMPIVLNVVKSAAAIKRAARVDLIERRGPET